jgi:hypothetical protein
MRKKHVLLFIVGIVTVVVCVDELDEVLFAIHSSIRYIMKKRELE